MINRTTYQSRNDEKEKAIASMIRDVVRNDSQCEGSSQMSNQETSSQLQIETTPQPSRRATDISPVHTPMTSNKKVKFGGDAANRGKTSVKSLFQDSDYQDSNSCLLYTSDAADE